MRITRDTWHQHFAECPQIFLNGIVMEGVIEADEEAGHVIVYETDDKGNALVDKAAGVFRTRKITGRVSIEGNLKPQAPPEPEEIDYTSFCGFWKERVAPAVNEQQSYSFRINGFDRGAGDDRTVIGIAEYDWSNHRWTIKREVAADRS